MSRTCWGIGGLLTHEFSHARHDKHLLFGFVNKDIMKGYDNAMIDFKHDNARHKIYINNNNKNKNDNEHVPTST